jgi:hypothetical protein
MDKKNVQNQIPEKSLGKNNSIKLNNKFPKVLKENILTFFS